jgi:hypothetical protein
VPTITIAATLFINKFSIVSRRFAGARRDSNFGANSLSYKEILVAIWLEGQVEGQGALDLPGASRWDQKGNRENSSGSPKDVSSVE